MATVNSAPDELSEKLSMDNLVNVRIAHLSMIQATISRMAGYSATAKNFCVTVLAALIALSSQANAGKLLLGAISLTILLGTIDIYYLVLERSFRTLYSDISSRSLLKLDLAIAPRKIKASNIARAMRSPSVILFYCPILAVCAVAFYIVPRQPLKLNVSHQKAGSHETTRLINQM